MHNFSESEKLAYMGERDDGGDLNLSLSWKTATDGSRMTDKMFHFTCFNVDPIDDPSVGLVNGELAIPGTLLRREVFDPVVNQVRPIFRRRMTLSASGFRHTLFSRADHVIHLLRRCWS